jgi:alpha-glucosidase
MFGGTAWEWDEATGQFYYHAFLKEQPDLNWRNPEVHAAMLDVMRFWLDRGVDGLRVDVMWHLIKDARWRDNPPNPAWHSQMNDYDALLPVFSTDQPEVHDIVREMRRVTDEYQDRMMIGEIYLPMERLVMYYGTESDGAHMPYNFQLLGLPWDASVLAPAIDQYEALLPERNWPNWVLGNHDQPRIASRVGGEQAAVAAMLLLTLRGTPTLYYGDEIGMRDVPIPADEARDPQELGMPGRNLGRDPGRTPMPWNAGPGAGFTAGKPWLRLDRDYARVNVEAQQGDPDSLLALHRRLLELRARSPALSVGAYRPVRVDPPLLAYVRELAAEDKDEDGNENEDENENENENENEDDKGVRFLIVLNLGHRPRRFVLPENFRRGVVSVATGKWREGETVAGVIDLWGDEGLVLRDGGAGGNE